jgi:hypothetical protein
LPKKSNTLRFTLTQRATIVRENRKKILCIEDDHETAALFAEELVDRGFDVQVTYDGMKRLFRY